VIDPLTPFVYWGWSAPYEADDSQFAFRAFIVPVQSKSGLVTSNRSGIAHMAEGVAALLAGNGSLRYGARWRCGGGSAKAQLIKDAEPYGGVCVRCVSAFIPTVYWCFNAGRRLLYIGSTGCTGTRFQTHKTETPWWPEVAIIKTRTYPTLPLARAAERMAIQAEAPAYNQQYQAKPPGLALIEDEVFA
jgi:hypothetical protein